MTATKYKAREVKSGEWRYGSFINNSQINFHSYIQEDDGNTYEVDWDTVCRYTGHKDMDDNEIYENDKLAYYYDLTDDPMILNVRYGLGTYDSGVYKYVGFYLETNNGYGDANGYVLLEKNNIKIIT